MEGVADAGGELQEASMGVGHGEIFGVVVMIQGPKIDDLLAVRVYNFDGLADQEVDGDA